MPKEKIEMPGDMDSTGITEEDLKAIQEFGEGDEEGEVLSVEEAESLEELRGKKPEKNEELKPAKGAKEEESGEEEDDDKRKSMVPHAALHQARLRQREAEARANQMADVIKEVLAKVAPAGGGPKKEEEQDEEIPDFMADPEVAFKAALKKINKLTDHISRLESKETGRETVSAQEQQLNNFRADVAREFSEAASVDPHVENAYQYLDAIATMEFQTAYSRSGVPIGTYKQKLLTDQAIFARRHGIPIAEHVKNLALARGWKPGWKPQVDNEEEETLNGKKPSALDVLKNKKKNSERHRSLSKVPGSGDVEVSLETLGSMSGAQLEKFFEKNPAIFDKLVQMGS